jgi:hypothetical protein
MGGVRKNEGVPGRVAIRGDIHVLLVGDPGLGKSQLLQVTNLFDHVNAGKHLCSPCRNPTSICSGPERANCCRCLTACSSFVVHVLVV